MGRGEMIMIAEGGGKANTQRYFYIQTIKT